MKHNPLLPVSAVLCWSMAFAFNGAALATGLSPTAIIAGRMFIAAAGFILLFRAHVIRYQSLPLRAWPRLLATSVVGLIIYHFALLYGQRFVSASAAAVVVMTSPVWATAISVLIRHERLTRGRVAGLALATAGAVTVLSAGGIVTAVPPLHATIVLIGAPISLALFTIMAKPLLKHGSANVTGQLIIVATIPMVIFAAMGSGLAIAPGGSWITGTLAVGGLGLVSTLLGYMLWFAGVDAVTRTGGTAAQVTAYQYLLPVFGGISAWILLGEPLGWRFALGTMLAVLGAYFVVARRGAAVTNTAPESTLRVCVACPHQSPTRECPFVQYSNHD